jgi:glycosyltransferase involved in cell wall biosynthesis
LIGRCLTALCASVYDRPEPVEIIVVANGCRDDTAGVARAQTEAFAAKGWRLTVIEVEKGGKLNALNLGDASTQAATRIYLDADVTVTPNLLQQVAEALDSEAARYASGTLKITAKGAVSRAYARYWRRVPFMRKGVPGCGLFAVNAAGRTRWGAFPDIISDDTFVRLSFTPEERLGVAAAYDWPIAEGFDALVRVRRRQDAGVAEIEARYPELLANDDKGAFPASEKLAIALRDPLGFMVYGAVALMVKLTASRDLGWSRGR